MVDSELFASGRNVQKLGFGEVFRPGDLTAAGGDTPGFIDLAIIEAKPGELSAVHMIAHVLIPFRICFVCTHERKRLFASESKLPQEIKFLCCKFLFAASYYYKGSLSCLPATKKRRLYL